MVLVRIFDSSNVGQCAYVMESSWPNACQSSSATCGAKGAKIATKASYQLLGTAADRVASFTKTIMSEIAVLNRFELTASVTLRMAMCRTLSNSNASISSSVNLSSSKTRQARSRNRRQPATPFVSQSPPSSSGPIKSSYSRNESAPYSQHTSSGLTTLYLDFDIFSRRASIVRPSSSVRQPPSRFSTSFS